MWQLTNKNGSLLGQGLVDYSEEIAYLGAIAVCYLSWLVCRGAAGDRSVQEAQRLAVHVDGVYPEASNPAPEVEHHTRGMDSSAGSWVLPTRDEFLLGEHMQVVPASAVIPFPCAATAGSEEAKRGDQSQC